MKKFSAKANTDRQNSWYWSVMVKNCGNLKKAEKEVYQSKLRTGIIQFNRNAYKVKN